MTPKTALKLLRHKDDPASAGRYYAAQQAAREWQSRVRPALQIIDRFGDASEQSEFSATLSGYDATRSKPQHMTRGRKLRTRQAYLRKGARNTHHHARATNLTV